MRRVEEVMNPKVVCVRADTRVSEAERLASEEGIRHLVVLSEGEIAGVLCACDLFEAVEHTPVEQHMSAPVYTISSTASLTEAADLMRQRGVGCLPVMQKKTLLGIVTRGDLLRVGFPSEALGERLCAACKTRLHVRPDENAEELALCLECKERAQPPRLGEDLGEGG